VSAVDDAVDKVIEAVNRQGGGAGFRHDQVAMQWPSLAAALAELMNVYGRKPPGSWRAVWRDVQSHG